MSDRIARTNKMEALFAQMSAVLTALQDNSLTPLELPVNNLQTPGAELLFRLTE